MKAKMNGWLAAFCAGVGGSLLAGTIGFGEQVSLETSTAEDYVLAGGTLVFDPGCTAYSGAISGSGTVINASGAPIDFTGASIAVDGQLTLRGERHLDKRYIRFTVLQTRRDDPTFSNQGPQFGEVELLCDGVVVPYENPTVTCTCDGVEQASAVAGFDNSNVNKIFTNVGSGLKSVAYTVDLGAARRFDAYRIYVGNDAYGRDPYSWTFEVSDDGVNWTLQDTQTECGEKPVFRCSPLGVFPLVARGAFFTSVPTVSVPAGSTLAVEDCRLDLAAGEIAGGIRLVDGEVRVAGDAEFSGTASGDGQFVLDGVTATGHLGSPLPVTCRFVRMTTMRCRGNGPNSGIANYGWAMSRINLLRNGERVPYPAGTYVTLQSSVDSKNTQHQLAAQSLLTDDNNAIYFDYEAATPIVITMPEPVTFDGYNWYSRGDMPCRDPRSWLFEYSEDGVKWLRLDTVFDCPYGELAYNGAEQRNAKLYEQTFAQPRFTLALLNGATFAGEYVDSGTVVREDGRQFGFTTEDETVRYSLGDGFWFASAEELPGKRLALADGELRYAGTGELVLDGYDVRTRGDAVVRLGTARFTDSAFAVEDGAKLTLCGETSVQTRYLRLTIQSTRPTGNYAGQGPAICEFELMRDGSVLSYSGVSVTAAAPGYAAFSPNVPWGIADNNTVMGNKDFEVVNSSTIPVIYTLDLGNPVEFDAYRWWSADQDGRDPYSWTLEASEDGQNWRLIDEQTAYRADAPLERWVASDVFPVIRPRTLLDADSAVEVAAGGALCVISGNATLADATLAGELSAYGAEVRVTGDSVFTGSLGGSGSVTFDGVAMNGTYAAGPVQTCRYYRFISYRTRPHGTYQNQGPQLSEIGLFLNGETVPYDVNAVRVSSYPAYADVWGALVDNNYAGGNKIFYNLNSGTKTVIFTVDLGKMTTFDGYGWWSGNDGTGRDPYDWAFEVSDNGIVWTRLDAVEAWDIELTGDTDNTTRRNDLIYQTTFAGLEQNVLADTATLGLGPDAAVTLDSVSETVGMLTGTGTVELRNGATLVVCPAVNNREIFSGSIVGEGTLVIRGGKFRYSKITLGEHVTVRCEDGGVLVETFTGTMIFLR